MQIACLDKIDTLLKGIHYQNPIPIMPASVYGFLPTNN